MHEAVSHGHGAATVRVRPLLLPSTVLLQALPVLQDEVHQSTPEGDQVCGEMRLLPGLFQHGLRNREVRDHGVSIRFGSLKVMGWFPSVAIKTGKFIIS